MLTQFARLSEMMQVEYRKVRIKQTTRFYREGSVLQGTIVGGPIGLGTAIDIESDEPADRIAEMVRLAEHACFALQSMIQNTEVTTSATINGATLDIGVARRS